MAREKEGGHCTEQRAPCTTSLAPVSTGGSYVIPTVKAGDFNPLRFL